MEEAPNASQDRQKSLGPSGNREALPPRSSTVLDEQDVSTTLIELHHTVRSEISSSPNVAILLANNRHCVFKLPRPSPSLTVKNMQNSILITGPVNGAAHVTSLSNCLLAISCRQLRMHQCHNCKLYISCGSSPIIEDCANMVFAPLPESLVGQSVQKSYGESDCI